MKRKQMRGAENQYARHVGSEIGNELERVARENAGTERYSNAHRANFEVNAARDRLVVTYKVGRKLRVEQAPYVEWDQVREALAEMAGREPMDAVDFATYHPSEFWLYRYHKRAPADLEGLVRF